MTETIEPMPTNGANEAKDHSDQQAAGPGPRRAGPGGGGRLVGPGGLLTGLTKTVLETALEAEITEHLGL